MIQNIPAEHLRKKFAQETMNEERFYEKDGQSEAREAKGISEGNPLLPSRRSVMEQSVVVEL
jgi:hypothetical protein